MSSTITLTPGVYGDSDLNVNRAQHDFLVALRHLTPSNVRIYVTSATRSPYAQASAMLAKWKLGGDQEITSLYGQKDLIQPLLSAPKDVNTWAAILEDQVKRGRFISRHMRGDALDIRSRDLPISDLQQIIHAAQKLGAETVVESKPPHLHIEEISSSLSQYDSLLQTPPAGAVPSFQESQVPQTRESSEYLRTFTFLRLSQLPPWAVGTIGASVGLLLLAVAFRVRSNVMNR